VLVGVHLDRYGTASERDGSDVGDRIGRRTRRGREHPRPPDEEVTVGGSRAGSFAPGDRMATHVAGWIDAQCLSLS
jgi:hypothetical protein